MNGNQILRIAMLFCAVIIVLAAVFNAREIFRGNPFGYAHAEKYTAGDAEISGTVQNLDIEWANGKVTLAYHSGNTIELHETSLQTIREDMKMRWWLDGDTLRVQYAKSGFRFSWNQDKELTVLIPEGSAFRDVSIRATSGALMIPEMKAETLNLKVTSGEIVTGAEAERISAGATSGSIVMTVPGETDTLNVGTTSGSVHVNAEKVRMLKASTTSGDILVQADQVDTCDAGVTSGRVTVRLGAADQVNIGSTSGTISVHLSKFSALKAHTTSGGITAELPGQPGFTAQLKTVSGRIDDNMHLSREGDRYIIGDGSGKVEFGSTSGNIRLNTAE